MFNTYNVIQLSTSFISVFFHVIYGIPDDIDIDYPTVTLSYTSDYNKRSCLIIIDSKDRKKCEKNTMIELEKKRYKLCHMGNLAINYLCYRRLHNIQEEKEAGSCSPLEELKDEVIKKK